MTDQNGHAGTTLVSSSVPGVATVVALYGYIGDGENTREWKASHQIHHPQEILQFI